MKAFILYIARVLLYTLGFFLVSILLLEKALFEPSTTLGTNKVEQTVQGHSYSTLIFGDSRAESNYIPSMLDSNAFNFGLSGTGNKLWKAQLEQELLNFKENRKIIVNVDLFLHPGDGQDYHHTYYLKVQNRNPVYAQLADSTIDKLQEWPWWYIGNMRYFLRESIKDHLDGTTVVERGYKGNTHQLREEEFTLGMPTHHFEAPFDSMRWKAIFDLANESEDEVWFVIAPIHQTRRQYLDLDSLNAQFKRAVAPYPNLHFVNLVDAVPEREFYYDPLHLNHQGAQRFSAILRTYLDPLAPSVY